MRKYRRALALLLALLTAAFWTSAPAEGPIADGAPPAADSDAAGEEDAEPSDPDFLTITLTGRIGLGDTTRWNTAARSLTLVGAGKPDNWLLGQFAPILSATI